MGQRSVDAMGIAPDEFVVLYAGSLDSSRAFFDVVDAATLWARRDG